MTTWQKYFSLSGNIDRMTFLKRSIVILVVGFIWSLFGGPIITRMIAGSNVENHYFSEIAIGLILVVPAHWAGLITMVKRVRDIGADPKYAAAALIMFAAFDHFVLASAFGAIAVDPAGIRTSHIGIWVILAVLVALLAAPADLVGRSITRSPARSAPRSPVPGR